MINVTNMVFMYRFSKTILLILLLAMLLLFPAIFLISTAKPLDSDEFIAYVNKWGPFQVVTYLYGYFIHFANSGIDHEIINHTMVREKLLAIIENLDQSLVIIQNGQISFLNSKFCELMAAQIKSLNQATQERILKKMKGLEDEPQIKKSWWELCWRNR